MGRLRSSRPKRKARKGPAEGTILSKSRAQKASKRAGGGRLKSGFKIALSVKREMAYDVDASKLVEHVSVGMAKFYSDQLKRGKRPSGRALPHAKPSTKGAYGPRKAPWVGMRTGWMADNWWLGKIRGGTFKSFRLVKPNGGSSHAGGVNPRDGGDTTRSFTINNLLNRRRPVDFQGVRGQAAKELARLFSEALDLSFPEIRTKNKATRGQALLPQVR